MIFYRVIRGSFSGFHPQIIKDYYRKSWCPPGARSELLRKGNLRFPACDRCDITELRFASAQLYLKEALKSGSRADRIDKTVSAWTINGTLKAKADQ